MPLIYIYIFAFTVNFFPTTFGKQESLPCWKCKAIWFLSRVNICTDSTKDRRETIDLLCVRVKKWVIALHLSGPNGQVMSQGVWLDLEVELDQVRQIGTFGKAVNAILKQLCSSENSYTIIFFILMANSTQLQPIFELPDCHNFPLFNLHNRPDHAVSQWRPKERGKKNTLQVRDKICSTLQTPIVQENIAQYIRQGSKQICLQLSEVEFLCVS